MSWVTWSTWPPCPYMVKNLKKSSSPEPIDWLPWNLVCSIVYASTTKIVQIMTLGWPWFTLRQGQFWLYRLLYGRKWKLFSFWILSDLDSFEKKITYPSHNSTPLPSHSPEFFFVRFRFFLKTTFRIPDKKSLILAATPLPPTEKVIHLCIIFGYLFSLTLSINSYYLEVAVTYISWSRQYLIKRQHIGHLSKQRARQVVRRQPF